MTFEGNVTKLSNINSTMQLLLQFICEKTFLGIMTKYFKFNDNVFCQRMLLHDTFTLFEITAAKDANGEEEEGKEDSKGRVSVFNISTTISALAPENNKNHKTVIV